MDAKNLSEIFADSLLPVTVFFGILAGFGVIANAYVFYVYKYNYSKCNFRTFVLCLAMIDFASCLFVLPSEMYGHRIWFSYPASAAWFCKVKTLVSGAAVFTSAFVLLLISVDRFRKVCRPLGKQMKVKTALRLCLMIFGIGSVIVIPCPILYGIQTTNITYEDDNFVITSCQKDDNYKESAWLTVYTVVIYFTPVAVFMFTTMVLYAKLIRKIFFGDFLKFEKKIVYTRTTEDGDRVSITEDLSINDTDCCHDSDEDQAEHEISSEDNSDWKTVHKNETNHLNGVVNNIGTSQQNGTADKEDSRRNGAADKLENSNQYDIDDRKETRLSNGTDDKKIKEQEKIKGNESEKHNETDVLSISENLESIPNNNIEYNAEIVDTICNRKELSDNLDIGEQSVSDKALADESKIEAKGADRGVIKKVKHISFTPQTIHRSVVNELKMVQKETNSNKSKMSTIERRAVKLQKKKAHVNRKRNIKTRSLIMFVVTLIFTITTSIYFAVFTVIYRKEHILDFVSPNMAALVYFLWRVYFVNHVINPFVYGFLDPRFRKAIKRSSYRLYNRLSKFKFSSLRRSLTLQ